MVETQCGNWFRGVTRAFVTVLGVTQIMANLPACIVNPGVPFAKCGTDYAGPFKVRLTKCRGKGTSKCCIALFKCIVTQTVHLELVEDTSELFIAVFHRFAAKRGHCNNLYSDQGTNFFGAGKELRAFGRVSSVVYHRITAEGTRWHLNPPKSPHFGRIWEATVKSAKLHLKRIMGEQILAFSEFCTLLYSIEAVPNSRPLAALKDDPTYLRLLTPVHFLIWRESFLVPVPNLIDRHPTMLKKKVFEMKL